LSRLAINGLALSGNSSALATLKGFMTVQAAGEENGILAISASTVGGSNPRQ